MYFLRSYAYGTESPCSAARCTITASMVSGDTEISLQCMRRGKDALNFVIQNLSDNDRRKPHRSSHKQRSSGCSTVVVAKPLWLQLHAKPASTPVTLHYSATFYVGDYKMLQTSDNTCICWHFVDLGMCNIWSACEYQWTALLAIHGTRRCAQITSSTLSR
jgi:hypothetical protein